MKGHLHSVLMTHRLRICQLAYLPKCICYPQTVVPGESPADVANEEKCESPDRHAPT